MQEPSGAFRHRESVTGTSPEGPADQDAARPLGGRGQHRRQRQGGGRAGAWPRASTGAGTPRSPARRPRRPDRAGASCGQHPSRSAPTGARAARSRCGTTSRPSTTWARASSPRSRCGAPSATARRSPLADAAGAHRRARPARGVPARGLGQPQPLGPHRPGPRRPDPGGPARGGARPAARGGRVDARAGRAGRRLPLRLDASTTTTGGTTPT